MFIRRQATIDSFTANFLETADGQILFEPPGADIGVPITWEEHAEVMAAFERSHTVSMVVTLAAFVGALFVGLHYVLAESRYVPFFVALAAAFVFSVALHVRNTGGLLLPFIRRREELLDALRDDSATGDAVHQSSRSLSDPVQNVPFNSCSMAERE